MMNWARKNIWLLVVSALFVYFLWLNYGKRGVLVSQVGMRAPVPAVDVAQAPEMLVEEEFEERMVVQNSSMSFVVGDVREVGDKIVKHAEENGGFMVSASYNRPDESAFATVTVRVLSSGLSESLDYFRSLAVKMTNENLVGMDVTEEYVDIGERLAVLETTKSKFEEILAKAVEVEDVLMVQREIINTQRQIDLLVGQRQALEKNAALTKVTLYLSTDELSLPYTPDKKLRPRVVFKLAVRSLVSVTRKVVEMGIWVGVYAVIWVPVLLVYWMIRKFRS